MEAFYDGVMWAAGAILAISAVAVGVALAAMAMSALRSLRAARHAERMMARRIAILVEIAGVSTQTLGQFGGSPIPASVRVRLSVSGAPLRYVSLPFVGLSTPATRRGERPPVDGFSRLGVTTLGGLLFAKDIPLSRWLAAEKLGVDHAS